MQADGDLWEQAWEAVLQRGHAAQTLSKAEGHATAQHVDEGLVRACDKEGNDWADELANKGAFQHEPYVVKLATWLQARQSACAQFMTRVHGVIIAVMQAERKERERRMTVQAALQGFDPRKEMLAPCTLPKHEGPEHAVRFRMIPPAIGIHRMGKRQTYYEAVQSGCALHSR